MSGLPDHNFPAFRPAAEQLRAAGYDVEDPAEKGVIDGWAWADYLRYDIRALVDCEGVALLPHWRMSRGARLEEHVARSISMTCAPVEWWLAR